MSGTRPDEPSPEEAWLPRRALVVGLGVTGRAAALALMHRGVEVVAADRSRDVDLGRLVEVGVELRLGTEEEALLEDVELLVKGPGVPGESPLPAAARASGIPIWSEAELGYRLLPAGNPLIGVTGTKGKTTTTRLLGAILEAAGRETALAGNEHKPLSEVAETVRPGTSIVCELRASRSRTSTALPAMSLCCSTSSPTTSTAHVVRRLPRGEAPHLRAGTREGRPARSRPRRDRVLRRRPAPGRAVDPWLPQPRERSRRDRRGARRRRARRRHRDGAPDLSGRPASPRAVRELRGVRWVNDSKATNTAAARRGVAAYEAPLRLILGGSLKGEDFEPLARELPGERPLDLSHRGRGRRACRRAGRRGPGLRPGRRLATAVVARRRRRPARRRRAPLTGVRELRPVRELRGAGRHVPASRGEPRMTRRAKPLQFEWNLLVLVTAALVLFGLVMVYSATSGSAVLGHANPLGFVERQVTLRRHRGGVARRALARPPREDPCVRADPPRDGARPLPRRSRGRDADQRGAPLDRPSGRSPSSRPSSRSSRSSSGWRRISRAAGAAHPRELGRPIGVRRPRLRAPRARRAGPRHRAHDHPRRRRDPARLGHPDVAARVRLRLVFALAAIAAWSSPYRRDRLLTFLDPWKDPTGAGLQNVQALISLGSGGIFGRGLGQGIAPLDYLPEAQTDMMSAVVGEELGLVGVHARVHGVRRLRLRRGSARDRLPGSLREAARGRHHSPRLRTGGDQHRRRDRGRAADRNPASVRLLRWLEPHRDARRRRRPP